MLFVLTHTCVGKATNLGINIFFHVTPQNVPPTRFFANAHNDKANIYNDICNKALQHTQAKKINILCKKQQSVMRYTL